MGSWECSSEQKKKVCNQGTIPRGSVTRMGYPHHFPDCFHSKTLLLSNSVSDSFVWTLLWLGSGSIGAHKSHKKLLGGTYTAPPGTSITSPGYRSYRHVNPSCQVVGSIVRRECLQLLQQGVSQGITDSYFISGYIL
jgi:hypothetical protein